MTDHGKGFQRFSAHLQLLVVLALVTGACSSVSSDITTTTEAFSTTTPPPATTAPPLATTAAPPDESTSTPVAPTTTSTTASLPPMRSLRLDLVAQGLHQPVAIASAAGDGRLFVAERTGLVKVVAEDGSVRTEPFLDLTAEVNDFSIEQGLLGLAFHPRDDGPERRLYVYFSVEGDDTMLVEYTTADADTVDLLSRREMLRIDQPAIRHNAGMIQFDSEGFLYLSLGDGGSGGSNGQDTSNPLGGIIKIDPAGDPYALPADNPFSGSDGAAELWVYGLRNPWRFSIDLVDGLVYIADVGQDDREEITVLELADAGANLGWSLLEGTLCFSERNCDPSGTVLPTIEYTHDDGCSVTGGFVYRGHDIPELHGLYFYSDWCSGWIRSFRYDGSNATDQQDWTDQTGNPGQVNTFGVDAAGELYLATWTGDLYRFAAER